MTRPVLRPALDAAPVRRAAAGERGFTLLELLVSLGLLMVVMAGVYSLLVENSRINRAQQQAAEAQANARNCLSMVVQVLRSAGWNPTENVAVGVVDVDPDLTDAVNFITVYADFNANGDAADADEEYTIRHDSTTGEISWRTENGGAFTTLAVNVTNDHDGDGNPDPMFVPDSTTDPSRITVTITCESPSADPRTGQPSTYTVSSDVVLRREL